jgi:hypothetical protein
MREPAIKARTKPTGRVIGFPACGMWDCDDDEDWEAVGPDDPAYSSVKREEQIARFHEPRNQWRERLQQEREKHNADARPLWMTY